MKGLLLKDLLNLRKQARIILLFVGFYFVLGVINQNGDSFGGVVALLFAMLTVTALAYDERAGWDKYALTMPVSRRELVLSKYLLGVLLSGVAFLLNLIFQLVFVSAGLVDGLLISLALFGVGLFFLAMMLPINFKWGVEKGRILMMIVLFGPTILITLLPRMGVPMPDAQFLQLLTYVLPVAAIALFAASVWISLRIYEKKEF
jgi:ABC-2 type transport system permease protein